VSTIVPRSRPGLTRTRALSILERHAVLDGFGLVGMRGYYRDSMGAPGRNDRGIYDDAVALVTPDFFGAWNANTDPSAAYRPGLACLKTGLWWYRVGVHGLSRPKAEQYTALVQAAAVTVARDGQGDDTGWFGINIHRGGHNTTSSLGCQTIHPLQWPDFIATVQEQLARHGRSRIAYALVEEQG
jgi:lysozyme